jgi:hypothetical protein
MAVTMNLKALESIHYFWLATKGKEKVGEQYIASVADLDETSSVYEDDFSKESVRKVLSAISNKEMFPWNKKEGRFWNNNMRMFEEFSVMESIVSKVKVLNLDCLQDKVNALEVVIVPGHIDSVYKADGKLVLNFFKFGLADETLTVEGVPIKEYIEQQL